MSSDITFDLLKEKWLPCLDLNGKPLVDELSLRQVFAQADRLSAIQGDSPLVTISLHRFLLAVLYQAIYLHVKRPTTISDWQSMWKLGHFDMRTIDDYFQRFSDHFDLFHPKHPFYQSLDAMGKEDEQGSSFPKNVAEMMVQEVAWGHNATLLDHRFESDGFTLVPAEVARRLIAVQAFGLGGTSGFYRKNYRIAPLVDSVIFLAQGDNLFETLLLNMQPYPHKGYFDSKEYDSPCWDSSGRPDWEDARSADNNDGYSPYGLLDYLTWPNRLVWLKPPKSREDCLVRQIKMSRGYKLKLDEVELDPMKSYIKKKRRDAEVFEPLRWDEHRVLWRDSATLFSVHVEGGERPPRAFKFISDVLTDPNTPLDAARLYRFSAFGISSSQAGVNFFRHETFPLPLEYLHNKDAFGKFKDNLAYAETIGKKLGKACDVIKKRLYAGQDKSGEIARKIFAEGVMRQYWSQLETVFYSMMVRSAQASATREQESTQWRTEVNAAVRKAFDEAIAGLGATAKAYELYVRGHERIWGNPLKRKSKKTTTKEGGDENMRGNEPPEQTKRFVTYLQHLKGGDRGAAAMSAMRHAINHSAPYETLPMFKYAAHWLNEEGLGYKPYLIQPLCLVASLFALHSENTPDGNMGTHLAKLCLPPNGMSVDSVERRFCRLLETPFDELPSYLPQVIRLLKSREQPVNWARLLADIEQWNEPTLANEVKRRWACEFWFRVTKKSSES
jgi:CRISPR system Cascade subunit CasA